MTGRSHQHILQAKEIETANFKSKTVSEASKDFKQAGFWTRNVNLGMALCLD
jgi:hypothetical protein